MSKVQGKDLAKISAPLDPGIKDAVEFLRGKGINTAGSCDAKHDDRKGQPWIFVDLREGENEFDVHARIVAELLTANYHGFTVQNDYLYQKSPTPWMKHLRITFWGGGKARMNPDTAQGKGLTTSFKEFESVPDCRIDGHIPEIYMGYEQDTENHLYEGEGPGCWVYEWEVCARCGMKLSEPELAGHTIENMNPSLPTVENGWHIP